MNKKVLIGIITVAAVILAATAAYMLTRPAADTSTVDDTTIDGSKNNSDASQPSNNTTEVTDMPVTTITYTDSGFDPSPLTVKKGTAITIANNSSGDLSFASADHPTHQINSELNIDTIKAGESGTVVITKTGTWGYHNHDNADHTGQIIVTE